MPSRYSSTGSIVDSRLLADRLGIRFLEVPIEPPFNVLLESVLQHFPGDGSRAADLTEQNLQSRIRGVLLMAFSNRIGALVLTTGNKSELATGYCTLYGDMVGGLAVLADVLKTQVYDLSRYVNREREIIPQAIIDKAPSAELKPDQTDQDDLPPYAVLDSIIQDYVENYRTPEQIAASRDLPLPLVRRLIRRVDHSEYKRQQAAPGLKISKKAFGMGRRLPIAQRYEAPPQPGDTLPALVQESTKA
jgi:NAD+ synthetase